MGLFNKKKKEEINISHQTAAGGAGDIGPAIDEELLAVIAAAVSAFEAEQFVKTLHIRKIDRTSGTRPAWGAMGTTEAIDMRRL